MGIKCQVLQFLEVSEGAGHSALARAARSSFPSSPSIVEIPGKVWDAGLGYLKSDWYQSEKSRCGAIQTYKTPSFHFSS